MNEHVALARARTERASGGHVNYYLIEIRLPNGTCFVVEVEDVIEVLDMEFAEANVFKAAVRMAKLRQDLGKPGSTRRYEIEKAVYYSARMVAKAERRARRDGAREGGIFALDDVIVVDEPKRLAPYSVRPGQLIEALEPTIQETALLSSVLTMCMVRRDHHGASGTELAHARAAVEASARLAAELPE